MFFAGFADLVIKWTLEHRSMNVGIRDGDIFLQDDPWVGSNHQMDTAVFGPVFVDGGLFAWIFNCVHQREVGGVEPGGFIQDAVDVYSEADVHAADQARRRRRDPRGRRRRVDAPLPAARADGARAQVAVAGYTVRSSAASSSWSSGTARARSRR